MKLSIPLLIACCFSATLLSRGFCQERPGNKSPPENIAAGEDRDLQKLIDKLVEISEPSFGYSAYFSGSEFLPYDETGQISTLVLGAGRSTRSEALREIVRRGAAAVPVLLKHIDDKRTIKMEPVAGMMWMDFSDEYDFNRRTRKGVPEGVNRDGFFGGKEHPNKHALTVGDLCFVALGQIVNRSFSATRYQPSGGLIVSSPTYSEALRKVIRQDWDALTAESHKRLLIEDFLKPDHEVRRTGAYQRLSLYYPETVEQLVVNELSKPTYDVFVVEEFCRETLYKANTTAARKSAYEEFLRKQGKVFAAGVQDQLFDDLEWEDRFGSRPRELLTELFGWPANVKPDDRPPAEEASASERVRLIEALTHDNSRRIGDIVQALFLKAPENSDVAPACLRALANRGYADFLVEQLQKIDPTDRKANHLHQEYIDALSTSKDPKVREKLLEILKRSGNETYFMAALPAVDRSQDKVVLETARAMLAKLPEDSQDGSRLLELIGKRAPEDARADFKAFLANGSANRAETMCRVLWYGHPLSIEILAPLLDDKRELPNFSIRMRVCDRAAQAISHAIEDIRFDSESSMEQKDKQIERLKQYCKEKAR